MVVIFLFAIRNVEDLTFMQKRNIEKKARLEVLVLLFNARNKVLLGDKFDPLPCYCKDVEFSKLRPSMKNIYSKYIKDCIFVKSN